MIALDTSKPSLLSRIILLFLTLSTILHAAPVPTPSPSPVADPAPFLQLLELIGLGAGLARVAAPTAIRTGASGSRLATLGRVARAGGKIIKQGVKDYLKNQPGGSQSGGSGAPRKYTQNDDLRDRAANKQFMFALDGSSGHGI